MASLFKKDPAADHVPSVYDRIGPEIAHLKKGANTRHGMNARKSAPWIALLVICTLLWFYLMDPFLHAWHKSDAIKAYLYLHQLGSDSKARQLVTSGILADYEARILNHQEGSFKGYFDNTVEAEDKADSIIAYMNGVHALQADEYKSLDTIGKIRCILFVRNGLLPPTSWSWLEPPIN